jgi:hypothetical protein
MEVLAQFGSDDEQCVKHPENGSRYMDEESMAPGAYHFFGEHGVEGVAYGKGGLVRFDSEPQPAMERQMPPPLELQQIHYSSLTPAGGTREDLQNASMYIIPDESQILDGPGDAAWIEQMAEEMRKQAADQHQRKVMERKRILSEGRLERMTETLGMQSAAGQKATARAPRQQERHQGGSSSGVQTRQRLSSGMDLSGSDGQAGFDLGLATKEPPPDMEPDSAKRKQITAEDVISYDVVGLRDFRFAGVYFGKRCKAICLVQWKNYKNYSWQPAEFICGEVGANYAKWQGRLHPFAGTHPSGSWMGYRTPGMPKGMATGVHPGIVVGGLQAGL